MRKLIGIAVALLYCMSIAIAQNNQDKIAPSVRADSSPVVTEWQWKEPGNLLGWEPASFANIKAVNGSLQGLTKDKPQLISPKLSINASQWDGLEFRIKSTVGGTGLIRFSREGEELSDTRLVLYSIVGDNQFHTYRVNLSSHPLWKGTITQLRFDPPLAAGAQLEIQYIRFLPSSEGLIPNGDFESTNVHSDLPKQWSFSHVKVAIIPGKHSSKALHLQAEEVNGQKSYMQSAIFEFPNTGQHLLELNFKDDTITRVACVITYFDAFHNSIKTQDLMFETKLSEEKSSSQWRTAKSTFSVPALAAYGQVVFELQPASQITLDNVTLNRAPAVIPSWAECWHGSWIKAPNAELFPDASRFLRRVFTVPKASEVTDAKIQATADDTLRVFINGHELPTGANWDNWKLPDIYDIKRYLLDGENVIGMETKNLASGEGLLAEISVQHADGESVINSDQNWSTFVGKPNADWSKATFNAADWKPALFVGSPSDMPWGGIPYIYQGHKLSIRAQAFSAPTQAKLGQRIEVQFDFIPQEKPNHATALKLQLASVDAASTDATFDFPPITLDTGKWQKGMPVRLRQSVQLPRYFRAGEYTLKANLTFAKIIGDSSRRISLKSPLVAASPVTKVVYLPGHIPAFEINGKIVPLMHTMTMDSAVPSVQKQIIQNSHDNNINLIWLNIAKGFAWEPNEPASFLEMDKSIAEVLNANPQAYVVLNVPLDPDNNPGMRKWVDMHPDQLVQRDDGSAGVSGYRGAIVKGQTYASFASPVWQHDAAQSWRELIRHVRNSSYADRVIGYVPISGISWEWFYWGVQGNEFVDYSKPFTQAFANWAKGQYHGDLALLNNTWNTQYTSFDAIRLPSKEQRIAADHGMFLDPTKSGQVIDLREFFMQVISRNILDFCEIVKEETQGSAICGTYYGYVMHIGSAYFGAQSGHYALGKVLSSPNIDFLMSPSPYMDRGIGGGSGYMTTVDSVKLHGKLYINQSDIRTFLTSDIGNFLHGKLDTLENSVSVLKRQFSDNVINGVATQWYTFGKGWITGDKRLAQAVGKMWQIEKTLQRTPRDTVDAKNSIAVITSEKSILYTKIDSMIQYVAVDQSINQLNRTGVAWDSYLLSDLPKLGNYRYYLFLNCFNLSASQRRYIDKNLKKDGNVLVWINSPGIIEDDKSTFAQAIYDPNRVSEVTGFKLKQIPDGALTTRMLAGNNPLQRGIVEGTPYGSSTAWGNATVNGTRFAAQDGVALGRFIDNDQTSLAVKHFANWTSIYSAAPTLPAALLRNIAHLAKVPVVNDTNGDITYVSKNLFAVHSLVGGERIFNVDKEYKIAKELFSDQSYVVQNGQFTAKVPPGGTMLFLLKD